MTKSKKDKLEQWFDREFGKSDSKKSQIECIYSFDRRILKNKDQREQFLKELQSLMESFIINLIQDSGKKAFIFIGGKNSSVELNNTMHKKYREIKYKYGIFTITVGWKKYDTGEKTNGKT